MIHLIGSLDRISELKIFFRDVKEYRYDNPSLRVRNRTLVPWLEYILQIHEGLPKCLENLELELVDHNVTKMLNGKILKIV